MCFAFPCTAFLLTFSSTWHPTSRQKAETIPFNRTCKIPAEPWIGTVPPNQVSVAGLVSDGERRSPCQRPFFAVLRRAGLLPRMVKRPRPQNVLGAERQRVDPVAVALELPDQLALRRLPYVYRAVAGAAKDATGLSCPEQSTGRLVAPLKLKELLLTEQSKGLQFMEQSRALPRPSAFSALLRSRGSLVPQLAT